MTSQATQSPGAARPATAPAAHGVVVAGIDRPELVIDSLRRHRTDATGATIPVYVLEPDDARIRDALDRGDLEVSPRLRILSGDGCAESFLDACRRRLECRLPNQVVASDKRHMNLARRAAQGLGDLAKEQTRQTDELRVALAERWAQRGLGHWRRRFDEIRNGAPARALVLTSRFSTFIRHAADDLAGAFNDGGHDARVIMEPDECTSITPLLCLRAIDETDPDLIVVINYPRAAHASLFPDGWPHICWVQDAMPHLFKGLGGRPTPLDFVAGHIYDDAAAFAGYDLANRLPFPVPVSERKFHAAPVGGSEFDADIAYVSHQSEPVETLHERFAAHFQPEQRVSIDECFSAIRNAIDDWAVAAQESTLFAARDALAQRLGCATQPAACDMLWHQYVHPVAERLLRHQTLEWAADIARRRGLRFRLYGSGWDEHPTLTEFASGPIAHDEALRACYQRTGVHLHASILGACHQRVYEAALSGGLPLVRRSWNELHRHDWYRMTSFVRSDPPADASLIKWRWPAWSIANHPELRSIIAERARMARPAHGWDHEHFEDVYAQVRCDEFFKYWDGPIPPEALRPIEILGDPFALTFSTSDELEACILRAIERPDERRRMSDALADRVRATASMSRFADRLLGFVTDRLASSEETDA